MSWDHGTQELLEPLFGPDGKDEIVIGFDTLDELSHGLGMLFEIDLLRRIGPASLKAKERAVRHSQKVLAAEWGDPDYLPLSEDERAKLEEFIKPNPWGRRDQAEPSALTDWENNILLQCFRLLLDNPEVRYRNGGKETWKKSVTRDTVCKILTRAIDALCKGVVYDENITLRPRFRYATRRDFDRSSESGGEEGEGLERRMQRAFPKAYKELEGWSKQETEGRPRTYGPYPRSKKEKGKAGRFPARPKSKAR